MHIRNKSNLVLWVIIIRILKREKKILFSESMLATLIKVTFLVGINLCPNNFNIYFTDGIIIPFENIMFFHIHNSGG